MSKTIELKPSAWEERFRVMGKRTMGGDVLMYSTPYYKSAENWIWNCPTERAVQEMRIEKVWVRKSPTPEARNEET